MSNFPAIYNTIEIVIWAMLSSGFVLAGLKQTGTTRTRCLLAGFWFALFSASDAVELQTGAWWKPWWLLLWKGVCVIALVLLYIKHRRSKTS